MASATLARDGTTVTIPLEDTSSGTPMVSRDYGKPNLEIQGTGGINPRHIDQWSGSLQYTIVGKFFGSSAYADAIELADLIKSNSDGTQLTLNVDMPEYDTDISVAPAAGQDEALNLVYSPGYRNYVELDLGLTRVDGTIAGGDQPASTPTATGSGPIQLTDGSATVDLTAGVTVSRSVGRPNSSFTPRPNADYPNHIDKFKTAYDAFELSFNVTSDHTSTVNDLVDMFTTQLSRNSLTLKFNGLYGMGDFNVVPDGSQGLRQTRRSGYEGESVIPTINLRRVI